MSKEAARARTLYGKLCIHVYMCVLQGAVGAYKLQNRCGAKYNRLYIAYIFLHIFSGILLPKLSLKWITTMVLRK